VEVTRPSVRRWAGKWEWVWPWLKRRESVFLKAEINYSDEFESVEEGTSEKVTASSGKSL